MTNMALSESLSPRLSQNQFDRLSKKCAHTPARYDAP